MEPIRYLQPAAFPPPALQYKNSMQEKLLSNRQCSGNGKKNSSNRCKSNNKRKKQSTQHNSNISGSNKCISQATHTHTTLHTLHQHFYPIIQRNSCIIWCLAFVILICYCNQAAEASPIFVDNPNLAQFQTGRNIRHLPCIVRKSGLSGTCMFAIDCIKQNGTHLGTCIDRFYFGSCCQIKEDIQQFAPEISDNSIDQNTILHFVPEATTLPTSALYKTTTESQLNKNGNLNSSSLITHSPTAVTKPTKAATTTTRNQTRKPTPAATIESGTQHKHSQFVVRTTKKPTTTKTTTTTRQKPTKTTAMTTERTSTFSTSQQTTTRKPSRRKPATTTSLPILTTNGPRPTFNDAFETTISPPKLFTFQMVETTTPAQTESTNFVDFTTLPPPPTHQKRPQTPTSTTQAHKTTAVTSVVTTIDSSTTKVKPSTTISQNQHHSTHRPQSPTAAKKPPATTLPPTTYQTTQKTKKPTTPTKKPTNKRPTKPISTNQPAPTTRPTHVETTFKPLPLADELPPTIVPQQKPTAANQVHHTKMPQTTRPKPIPTVTKTPGSTIITTTMSQHKTEQPTTTFTTKRPTKPSQPNKTTLPAAERPLITRTTTSTTAKPITTTTLTTTAAPKTNSPTTQKLPGSSSTFKPGLITWTNENAEPIMNATITADQQQWLPVPTIAPESTPINKNEVTSAAPITSSASTSTSTTSTTTTTTKTTPSPTPSPKPSIASSTEKIIVSVSSSVSEVHHNETRQPPHKPPTQKPQSPPLHFTTIAPISKLPDTSTQKPSASATPQTPADAESTTLDYEGTIVDSSTDGDFEGSATTGFMTEGVTEGVTEDYNATMIMGTPTATTLPPTPANSLEGVDYRQICGRRMFPEPRIVGGSNSAFGRWPWQVSLRQWRTSTYLHKCGAALLNENWAITAAHCVDNVPPSDLLLRLGEYDLAEEEEPYGYQERRVQIVASHPQFDPRTFEYDLALLRFYEPVVFQPNIIPVCVPNSDEDFIGQTAFVTGWGRLYEDGPLPSVLQEVAVPVINNSICETMYRAAGYIEHIPHIFICAGWKKGGYDSCEGDSGGPMVLQREDDRRFQLGGVISWGIGCAEANQPGVYTRISEFRDWINQILQF